MALFLDRISGDRMHRRLRLLDCGMNPDNDIFLKDMSPFNKILEDVFFESPIDPIRNSLDPDVFDDDEEMNERTIKFLKKVVDDFNDNITPVVGKSLIKGSILSYQWLPHTDVDLLIEIDENINDHQWDIIKDQSDERYDGLKIPGTKHPLQVFPLRGEYDYENADGIYDIYKGWVKGPYVHEADLSEYMDQFDQTVQSIDLTTGELKRDLVDYGILSDLDEDDVKGLKAQLAAKLDEIDAGVEELIGHRNKVRADRHAAFDRGMTPQEIKKFGSKNLLPANIMLKLLERYHYMAILSKINKLKKDDDYKLSDADIEELDDLFNIEEISED